MLLVSGLGLGSHHADSMLGLQLLVDMVTGQLGGMGEQSRAATISRVLLAGNLLSQNTQDKDASTKVARLVLFLTCSHLSIPFISAVLLGTLDIVSSFTLLLQYIIFHFCFLGQVPHKEDSGWQCGSHSFA